MMSVSGVILHVGAGKTGSSAVQTFLAHNRGALIDAGVDYPADPHAPDGYMGGNARPLARFAAKPAEPKARAAPTKLRTALAPIVEDAHASRLILSNEQIFKAGAAKLAVIREALAGLDRQPVIVCVFRELASHAVSVYSQLVRNHCETRLLPEFLKRHEPPFLSAARALKSVFGPDQVRFKVYARDPADNLRRFLQAAEIEGLKPPADPAPVNRSLTAHEIGVMRHLNALDLPPAVRRQTLQRIADTLTAQSPAPDDASAEPHALEPAVWDRLARLTEAINAECFAPGEGLPEPPRTVPDRSKPYAALDPQTARLAELTAAGFAEVAALRNAAAAQRRR